MCGTFTHTMNFSDIKIAKRLAIGFGLMLALLLGSQLLGLSMLTRISDSNEELVDLRLPNINTSNALLTEINDIAIALRNMMLDSDPADRRKQLDEIAAVNLELPTRPRIQVVVSRQVLLDCGLGGLELIAGDLPLVLGHAHEVGLLAVLQQRRPAPDPGVADQHRG